MTKPAHAHKMLWTALIYVYKVTVQTEDWYLVKLSCLRCCHFFRLDYNNLHCFFWQAVCADGKCVCWTESCISMTTMISAILVAA